MIVSDSSSTPNDLADFVSLGRKSPIRVGIYGPNGVGKTTFIASVPHVFILPTEDGAEQIRVPQWKKRVRALDEFHNVIDMLLKKRHPYEAIGVDSASALERLLIEAIEARLRKVAAGKKEVPLTIAELNEDFGAGYQAVALEWQCVTDRLDELRDQRGMSVWVTCPSKTENIKNLEGRDFQSYTLDLFSAKSTKVLTSWLDYVLFARQDVLVSEEKKKVIAVKGQLSVYTRGTAVWLAKTRGEIPWPDRLPLDFDIVMRLHELIRAHGKDLAAWLTGRFEAAIGPLTVLDADGAVKATKGFVKAISKGTWHLADAVCTQMESEISGEG